MMNLSLFDIQSLIAVGAAFSFYFLFKKNKKAPLMPELIPYSMHYKNVRAIMSAENWKIVAKKAYAKANYKCDICKTKGRMECHEIWHFDDQKLKQTLVGLTALCCDCHRVKHIGLAKRMGHYDTTIKHMAKVNGISVSKAEKYVEYAEMEVKRRKGEYALDLTYLNSYCNNLPRKYTTYENANCQQIQGNF